MPFNHDKLAGEFLRSRNMHPENIHLETMTSLFLSEMDNGLQQQEGNQSSLMMLPTYIQVGSAIPQNDPVIVIDAGGTHFRVAVMEFNEKEGPSIRKMKQYPMPGTEGEVGKDEFFDIIAQHLKDVLNDSLKIGFVFSYPTEIFPDKDGRLIHFCKEVKAPQVEGELIGQNLLRAIGRLGVEQKHQIVILNDSVATLLAGKAGGSDNSFSSYVGFILGTGTNICYIENNNNIHKLSHFPVGHQIINVESGGYRKVSRSSLDLAFDESTLNPGNYVFEKMISGRYLGMLCLHVLHCAAAENLFSPEAKLLIESISQLDTKEINACLSKKMQTSNPLSAIIQAGNPKDIHFIHQFIDLLSDRAAKLTAGSLAAAVLKSGQGARPERPVCISADGSTFLKFVFFRERVQAYLEDFLVREKQRYFEIITLDNAPLIGGAIAGLTNTGEP